MFCSEEEQTFPPSKSPALRAGDGWEFRVFVVKPSSCLTSGEAGLRLIGFVRKLINATNKHPVNPV
jgi:hypothetical protein